MEQIAIVGVARKLTSEFEFSVCAPGNTQFRMCTNSLLMGGHARVGLEGNLDLKKGLLAKSNAELVLKIIRIAREFCIEPARPQEGRNILGLIGLDRVGY